LTQAFWRCNEGWALIGKEVTFLSLSFSFIYIYIYIYLSLSLLLLVSFVEENRNDHVDIRATLNHILHF
jgi:hypothetical protein